jgi:hypothetical protein
MFLTSNLRHQLPVSSASSLLLSQQQKQRNKQYSYDYMGSLADQPSTTGASKGLLLNSSTSCKTLPGTIIEGGSSSSEENKRPFIVHEQKTEED